MWGFETEPTAGLACRANIDAYAVNPATRLIGRSRAIDGITPEERQISDGRKRIRVRLKIIIDRIISFYIKDMDLPADEAPRALAPPRGRPLHLTPGNSAAGLHNFPPPVSLRMGAMGMLSSAVPER